MRYLMDFSYDGSCFYGFERQKNLFTVQGVLEEIFTLVNNGKKVKIHASGRTDKGVHAKHQMAHFDLDVKIKIVSLIKFINKKCDGKIFVNSIICVDDDFHARYMAKNKTYTYIINCGEFDIFSRNYVYQYNKKLNIKWMKKASKYLLGTHNFKSFCNDSIERDNFVRTIYSIDIVEDDNLIKISICGDGFLKCMVRNIVAVLINIGSGIYDVSSMKEIISLEDRSKYILKAVPGCGLYLDNVRY